MTLAGVKVCRVDGQYRYQPPTLKFACVRVLDHNFPDPRDSKLYTNVLLCIDELVNLVEVRVKGIEWGGMIKVVTLKLMKYWIYMTDPQAIDLKMNYFYRHSHIS